MRFVILSQWCWPEPGFKILSLAQGLVQRGNEATVITGFPNYPQGKVYPGYRIQPWKWEEHEGVRVLRLPLLPYHGRSKFKRAVNCLSFALSASVLGPLLCGSADVMWVYHPPLTIGIPAWWIGLLRRVPFVFEIQDMWPESLTATAMAPPWRPSQRRAPKNKPRQPRAP